MTTTLSVSQLLTIIKDAISIDRRLQLVLVSGELSNFTLHKSGHAYFSIKDDKAKINCVMFRSSFSQVRFIPKDGMAVLLSGYVSVYEAGGQVQINVSSMQEAGIGELYLLLEKLKSQLEKEGLFSVEHKKSLPKYPERIAVISGKGSAAAADITINLNRRWPLAHYEFFTANMQGRYGAPEIIEQLALIDKQDYDLLIIARGGGSFEDLYCFNEEKLVRAIFAMHTPVVTGIGHQSDLTLSDLVADIKAPTPTAAVELATPDINEVKALIKAYQRQLMNALQQTAVNQRMLWEILWQRLKKYESGLLRYFDNFRLLEMEFYKKLENFTATYRLTLQEYNHRLLSGLSSNYQDKSVKIRQFEELLKAYNPRNVLQRGYAIITKNHKLIASVGDVKTADDLVIQLKDGRILSKVKDIEDGKEI